MALSQLLIQSRSVTNNSIENSIYLETVKLIHTHARTHTHKTSSAVCWMGIQVHKLLRQQSFHWQTLGEQRERETGQCPRDLLWGLGRSNCGDQNTQLVVWKHHFD